MAIKYMTGVFCKGLIELVEVENETQSSVWINGRRQKKQTAHRKYFDTWGEAKDFLMKEAEIGVRNARARLEIANSKLGNVKGLNEPVND